MCSTQEKPVFRDLTAEDPEPEVTEIESLCVNCHANGNTRLLLTRIPHYKNVVLMSFSCEECGFENNEIQPGGAYEDFGVRWKLRVESEQDLNRQVVKSDYTRVRVPEVDLEVPAQSQRGEVTTVEGIVARTIVGLSQQQTERRAEHPDAAMLIDQFLQRLQLLRAPSPSNVWHLELEDISGNTYIENPCAPRRDPRCERTDFKRTREQNHALGIFTHNEVSDSASPAAPVDTDSILTPADPGQCSYEQLASDEVMCFRTNCPDCNAPADTNMKLTKIPHFKEVVIMATVCDACGHRTNEVKSGGGVEPTGVRFEVRVASRDDFSRDILKSETCSMQIPELELEVGGRALGGRFTTAEGLLRATAEQLAGSAGVTGDAPALNPAADNDMEQFIGKLQDVLELRRTATIVLDDPAGNSYVQSLSDDPAHTDDGLKITRYERTYEQNEELGLNDIKTEGYEESAGEGDGTQ